MAESNNEPHPVHSCMGITNNQGSTDNVVIIEDDSSRPADADVIPPCNDSSLETEVSHSLESQQTIRR